MQITYSAQFTGPKLSTLGPRLQFLSCLAFRTRSGLNLVHITTFLVRGCFRVLGCGRYLFLLSHALVSEKLSKVYR